MNFIFSLDDSVRLKRYSQSIFAKFYVCLCWSYQLKQKKKKCFERVSNDDNEKNVNSLENSSLVFFVSYFITLWVPVHKEKNMRHSFWEITNCLFFFSEAANLYTHTKKKTNCINNELTTILCSGGLNGITNKKYKCCENCYA